MATPLKPLAPEIIREALYASLPSQSELMTMLLDPDPWPHHVYYYTGGTPFHLEPEFFHVRHYDDEPGPSDCVWIVPGTAERSRST